MNDRMVMKWVQIFKDGRTNMHDDKQSGHLSVISVMTIWSRKLTKE